MDVDIHVLPQDKHTIWQQVEDIFLESSAVQSFESATEKKKFIYKYLEYYKIRYPELFIVASVQDKIMGYICASSDTISDNELFKSQPHLESFTDYYPEFPAHLHINCHRESRGLGVGSILVKALESVLGQKSIKGLHLITTEDARNVKFYEKNNYSKIYRAAYNGANLILMGKPLGPS